MTGNQDKDREREQAEKALKESERFLRSTLDGLSAQIVVLNERGEIILTNKAYRDFGERNCLNPGAVSEGTNYLAVCDTASGEHSQEATPFADGIREVLSGKLSSFELEYPCHSPDEKRWFIGRVTPINDEGPRRVVIAHENITERKEAENVLRESEEKKFSTAFQTSPYAITITRTKDGKFIEVNDAFETMTGFTREEAHADSSIGLRLWMNIEDRDRVVNDLRAGRTVVGHEYRFRRKDDTTFIGTFSARAILLGGEHCILSSIMDITERKRMEEALRESLERLELSLRGGELGMWDWNPQDGSVVYSDHWAQMLGYRPDEVEPTVEFFKQHVHPEDLAAVLDRLTGHIEGRLPIYESEHRVRTKSGRFFWVMDRGKIVERDKAGSPVRVAGIIADITERKKIETRNEMLSLLIERSQDFIGLATPDQHAFFVNPAGREMLGIENDEMVKKTKIEEYFFPEDIPFVNNTIFPQLMREGRWAGEFRFKHFKTGEPIDVYYDLFLTEDPVTREAINISTITRDITLQKRIERELIQAKEKAEESEERFNLVMKASHDGLFDWNLETNGIYYSPGWKKMLGYEEYELPNDFSVWENTTEPEDVKKSWELQQKLITKQIDRFVIEFKMKHKDGHWIDVLSRAQAIFNDSGKAVRIVGTHTDITERKRAEEAEREQRDFSDSVIETAPAIILVLDTRGRIVRFNPFMEQLAGYELDEVKGMDWFETFLTPELGRTIKPLFQKTVADVDTSGNVNPIIAKDGRTIPVEWHNKTLKDKDGRTVGILAIGQDITERKQAEAEREKLQAQLIQSQKMEAVGQLAGGIAHDFNNILVPIIGYAELGMMGLSPNDKLYANLQHIHRAAERAAALTRQILAFSRKQILEIKSLNLNEVVTNFEKMVRRLIGEDITLKAVLSPALALVQADPAQIEQILLNLAINARDAMPQGGKLTIETDNLFLDERYTHAHIEVQPGPYVMLAVSDTGIGMDAETKEHIFEPFFTTKPKGTGTGLGLATVFGIVKQHQGYIWVYSEPGQGTTFKVYLPQAGRTEPDMTTPAQPDSLYGTETILLVEDETMVRKLACETLTAHGYTVLEAQSPAAALRLAADYQDTINLLLTDVIMPEMNGRQLYEKVAAIRPEINVLYMSGYTDNVIVNHGVLYQDVNFLQKPFTVHRLTQKVREALR